MFSRAEWDVRPARFSAAHEYSPPSSTITWLMFTWLMTSPCTVTYWPIMNLPGNPSSVQEIWGVGFPWAEHLSETAGPGCSVCSMKLYTSEGGASGGWKNETRRAAAGKGSSTSVPLRRTRRTPPTSPTDVPSTDSQSIEGCGLPEAEQSSQPPDELENSSRDGGSITNDGPRRCESNAADSSVERNALVEENRHGVKRCYPASINTTTALSRIAGFGTASLEDEIPMHQTTYKGARATVCIDPPRCIRAGAHWQQLIGMVSETVQRSDLLLKTKAHDDDDDDVCPHNGRLSGRAVAGNEMCLLNIHQECVRPEREPCTYPRRNVRKD
uniref:Uncharacterized protein n=1 Tax=Anopheles atroparvus TaxID=41427 RepID=A0A182J5V1_ANOAO